MAGAIRLAIKVPSYVLTLDKKKLRSVLRRAGSEVAALARAKIKRSVGGGVIYRGPGGSTRYRGGYKPGKYQASAAGQAPVSVTNTLANSIKVRPFKNGDGVAVRETVFYALFLQSGAKGGGRRSSGGKAVRGKGGIGKTRVLAVRPSLTDALDERESSLSSRIQDAVLRGIQFKRIKA